MSPVTHLLSGWVVANVAPLSRRERAIVTIAAVVPDVDGLGFVPELLTRHSSHPLLWFSEYHHALHTLLFAIVISVMAFSLAKQRLRTASLAFGSFHVHLIEDLVGSRGPDGFDWSIPYLAPFSNRWQWAWHGQWGLNAWPNVVLTMGLLALTFYLALQRSYSPVELFSTKADRAVVAALRGRFRLASR